MPTGIIKKIVAEKGFGFISVEGSEDIFFHMSSLGGGASFDSLQEGQSVTFNIVPGDGGKGPKAADVVPA